MFALRKAVVAFCLLIVVMKKRVLHHNRFVLILAAVLLTYGVQGISYGQIYWTDQDTDKIQRSNLDGSNVQDLVTTGNRLLSGIALDEAGGKMYWADWGSDTIERANLDGSNVETLVTGLDNPWGIALDVANGKIYWTVHPISSEREGKIQRSNLNGSNIETLVTGLGEPDYITLDVANGKMYWTIAEAGSSKIQRANLNGSNVETLVTTELSLPGGIALAVGGGKMYWTDWGFPHQIQCANLNGSNVQTLITFDDFDDNPWGIALDVANGKIYWTVHPILSEREGKIQRSNLNGSNIETLVTGLGHIDYIAIGSSAPAVPPPPVVREVVAPGSSQIYWTDTHTDKIQRSSGDGSHVQDLVILGARNLLGGIALDMANGKMYWADWGGDQKIERANLDGSNIETLVTFEGGIHDDRPWGIALDVANGKMYWTIGPIDDHTSKIQRANLDGTNIETLVTGLYWLRNLALDVVGGKMYWTIAEANAAKIERSNLNGTNIQTLVTTETSLPGGIALAVGGGKMYWTDWGRNRIQCANLDGSNVQTLVALGVNDDPQGIALDIAAGKMYWTIDPGGTDRGGKIQRANLNGSNIETVITGLGNPQYIAISAPAVPLIADLVVERPTVDKSTLALGETFTLSATVKNQGTGRAAATTLRYYRSTDTTISTEDTAIGTDSVSGLAANQRGAESINLTAPTSPGTYYYGACVEAVSDESNSNNNCSTAVRITVEQLKSDLVVEPPTVSQSTLTTGETFTLSTTVRNAGSGGADSTTLRYYRSTDATISPSDTEVGTDSVSGLGTNESSAESISLTAPTSPGTYYYGACVEAVTDESASDNNCSTAVSITVQQPTLSTSTPSPLIETTLDGSEVTLTLTGATYEQTLSNIENAVMVSGIAGVTVGAVRRKSETEVTVALAFDGTDFDTDATLTFSVDAAAIANYQGAALTAQVSVTAIKAIEFDLSVPAGISLIHVPLQVTAVDGEAQSIESIADLYTALGGASNVTFLITYDSQTQGWLSYFSASDAGTSADRELTDEIGILVNMKTPAAIRLSGNALGINGNSTITLNQGFNLVGLPLRDSRINRVSDLFTLEGIGGNVPVITLTDAGEFKAVGRAGDPGDISVTGGQAFILSAQQSATVALSGQAWSNVSKTAAPPAVAMTGIEVGGRTPVLGVSGSIVDKGTGINQVGSRVTIKNLSTGREVTTATVDDETGYRLTIVDIETARAAMIGDLLEVKAQSADPLVRVELLRYTVTAEDVKQSRIHLPALVAYQIPAETQLLANYPNPFNPETWIPYRLAKDAFVSLTIYDQSGQVVRALDVGHQGAGVYESRSKAVYWDGRNEFGETVASGVYFYHLLAGDYSATRKMLILK